MSGFSDAIELALLNHVFLGGAAYTRPSTLHVGLFTADPGDDGAGATEISGNSYARTAATFAAAASGAVASSADVTFPQATGTWGTISHFGIFDAASGGTMLNTGTVTGTPSIVDQDTLTLPSGQLTVSLD